MDNAAVILDGTTNAAVVQLPGRKFPGVVVQGDSLKTLVELAAEASNAREDPSERTAAVEMLHERLAELLRHYEEVLGRSGRKLPY